MAVFTAAACLGHPGFPEQPERLAAIRRRLVADGRFVPVEVAPAGTALLEERHDPAWLDAIRERALAHRDAGDEVPLVPASWPAILGAAAAMDAAIAAALEGDPAFAAVRPPGHHASGDVAMGFCAVNLVACAVARMRRAGAERVLVVDWDVHHGNGTQAIVAAEPATRFVSMHQHPWYPGTGMADEVGVGNCFNLPMSPDLSRATYREALWDGVLRATADGAPDGIVVSAGYDAMAGDPLGGFTLEPEDFAEWIRRLRESWPDAPLVAALEGGYAPERLADGVLATVAAMTGHSRLATGDSS